MELSLEWYGYGVGLVMFGWVIGMAVGLILDIFRRSSSII